MKISDDWILKNATKNGGYTKRQLAIVGIDWPPVAGWKAEVIGLDLDRVSVEEFEQISAASYQ
jgi:hypothetical protein